MVRKRTVRGAEAAMGRTGLTKTRKCKTRSGRRIHVPTCMGLKGLSRPVFLMAAAAARVLVRLAARFSEMLVEGARPKLRPE